MLSRTVADAPDMLLKVWSIIITCVWAHRCVLPSNGHCISIVRCDITHVISYRTVIYQYQCIDIEVSSYKYTFSFFLIKHLKVCLVFLKVKIGIII